MASHTITFNGTTEQARERLALLGLVLSGQSNEAPQIHQRFLLAMGLALLGNIKSAYVVKARGGTDEMGIKWAPLQPQTIANRRVGPRDTRTRKGASKQDADRAQLIKEREKIRKREYKKILKRLGARMPIKQAKTRASRAAGQIATRITGKTKVQTLGSRQVEILRDTGVLLNSLTPADRNGDSYSPPPGQIMNVQQGAVAVGTNVLYAATHQHGDKSRNIPARPFLPVKKLPREWVEDINEAGAIALAETLEQLFK